MMDLSKLIGLLTDYKPWVPVTALVLVATALGLLIVGPRKTPPDPDIEGTLPASRKKQTPKPARVSRPRSIPPLEDTDKDGLVVILSGVAGDAFAGTPSARTLGTLLSANSQGLGQALTYQIWNWHLIETEQFLDLVGEQPSNVRRGRVLAEELRNWKLRNATRKVYLVAGSGGGWVAALACEATDVNGNPILGPGFFERVVFLSTALQSNRDLSKIAEKAKYGVFSYWSSKDKTLPGLGIQNAGGVVGFEETIPMLRQLAYADAHSEEPYLNNGGHLQCYAEGFIERFILPLFNSDLGRVPPDWK